MPVKVPLLRRNIQILPRLALSRAFFFDRFFWPITKKIFQHKIFEHFLCLLSLLVNQKNHLLHYCIGNLAQSQPPTFFCNNNTNSREELTFLVHTALLTDTAAASFEK